MKIIGKGIDMLENEKPIDVFYDMDISQICQHFLNQEIQQIRQLAKLVKDYPDKDWKYKNPETRRITIKAEGVEKLSNYFRKEKHEVSTVEMELRYENDKLKAIIEEKEKSQQKIEQLYQLLGNLWPTKWLKLGPIMGTARLTLGLTSAHRKAHSWAYLGPLRGSLLAIGRKVGRYSCTRPPADARGSGYRGQRSDNVAGNSSPMPPCVKQPIALYSVTWQYMAEGSLGSLGFPTFGNPF